MEFAKLINDVVCLLMAAATFHLCLSMISIPEMSVLLLPSLWTFFFCDSSTHQKQDKLLILVAGTFCKVELTNFNVVFIGVCIFYLYKKRLFCFLCTILRFTFVERMI